MKKYCITVLVDCLTAFSHMAQTSSDKQESVPSFSRVWVSDQGDGTYVNPVLHADYSDPDIFRVGDDYYMTASSFNCIPGLPILHSRDLVNWQLNGHALHRQPPFDFFDKPPHGCGVWAPCLRYHNGEFRIFCTEKRFY